MKPFSRILNIKVAGLKAGLVDQSQKVQKITFYVERKTAEIFWILIYVLILF